MITLRFAYAVAYANAGMMQVMPKTCERCDQEIQGPTEIPGICDTCYQALYAEHLLDEEDHTELWTRDPAQTPLAVRPFSVNKRGEVTQLGMDELAYILNLAGYTKVQDVDPLQADWIDGDGVRHQ